MYGLTQREHCWLQTTLQHNHNRVFQYENLVKFHTQSDSRLLKECKRNSKVHNSVTRFLKMRLWMRYTAFSPRIILRRRTNSSCFIYINTFTVDMVDKIMQESFSDESIICEWRQEATLQNTNNLNPKFQLSSMQYRIMHECICTL